jgi:hypothetical protein
MIFLKKRATKVVHDERSCMSQPGARGGGFPVSWVPLSAGAAKKPGRHGFGTVLLHWLYFWVDNFKKKCTTKVVIEKKSCIFPKIIL